jgi:hypothetical protein
MGQHLRYDHHRAGATPPEWLQVGRSVGELVNQCALRNDVIAYIGPGAGGDGVACYNPTLGEVEVNVERAFGKGVRPDQVGDFTKRDQHYEFPRAAGAVMHEAFHARFSLWGFERAAASLTPDEFQSLLLLEESRIESYGRAALPESLVFLRSSALELAIGDAEERFAEGSNVRGAAMIVALVHGRVEAGVLEREEVESLLLLVESALGSGVVGRLVDILRRVHLHADHANVDPLCELAREWEAVVREAMEAAGEDPNAGAGGVGAGAGAGGAGGGDADDEGGSPLPGFLREALEALEEAADEVRVANHGRLADQERDEGWRDEAKQRGDDAKRRQEAQKVAGEVFGGSHSAGGGTDTGKSFSVVQERRLPTPQERSAAVIVAGLLERAKYRDRDATEIATDVPPGRLRTRALVQGAAMRSRGVIAPVQPWRRTVRKVTDDPTLTVGVMVDISGSMVDAMEAMATTAWVMGEATRRVQGRCAMVYYGNDVFPTLRVGQQLPEVTVWTAPDNTEKFHKAFTALDGELDLLDGSGARLLVVVSDGHYTADETKRAMEAVDRCARAGVAVLWLPFRRGHMAAELTRGNAEVVEGIADPAAAATAIGNAAAVALTRAGSAR